MSLERDREKETLRTLMTREVAIICQIKLLVLTLIPFPRLSVKKILDMFIPGFK